MHAAITNKFASLVASNEERYKKQFKLLNQGLLTINHNDLCENNILFGTGKYRGKIYIIDWTCPSIGSICIDLVELVKNTPLDLQSKLIQKYRTQIDFDNFEAIYTATSELNDLSHLSWVIKGVLNNDFDLEKDDDFKDLVKKVYDSNVKHEQFAKQIKCII